MNQSTSTVISHVEDGLLSITLNQPDRRNPLSRQTCRALEQIIAPLAKKTPRVRALLISGAGGAFSSGADLSEALILKDGKPDLGQALQDYYHPFLEALYLLDIPIIMAVDGAAAGAGLSLVLYGDFIFATPRTYFSLAFSKIGLAPDAGASFLLPRLIGEARARRLMISAGQFSAQDAYDWGLLEAIVPEQDFVKTTRRFAKNLAQGPTKSYGEIRALLRRSTQNDYHTQLELEAACQTRLGLSRDFVEGVAAFREKRLPAFTGD